jgi:putative transposase
MTAPSSIDPAHFLHEQLAQASPDLLRQMLTTFIDTLMSAEADAVCGARSGKAPGGVSAGSMRTTSAVTAAS